MTYARKRIFAPEMILGSWKLKRKLRSKGRKRFSQRKVPSGKEARPENASKRKKTKEGRTREIGKKIALQ